MHPHHKAKEAGLQSATPHDTTRVPRCSHRADVMQPGRAKDQHLPFSVLGTVTLIAFPPQLQLCPLDFKQQPWIISSPGHHISLVRKSVISCIFLISKVPRDKKKLPQNTPLFLETEERLCWPCLQGGGFFLILMRVCFYHTRAEGSSGRSRLHLEELSSNIMGLAHPSQASSPVIFHTYIISKYCSVCILHMYTKLKYTLTKINCVCRAFHLLRRLLLLDAGPRAPAEERKLDSGVQGLGGIALCLLFSL